MVMMRLLLLTKRDLACSRAKLQVELLAVRHQLHVLDRTRPRRVRVSTLDRCLWVGLSRVWSEWRRILVVVEPATVVAWHRRGVRLFWTWEEPSPHRSAMCAACTSH